VFECIFFWYGDLLFFVGLFVVGVGELVLMKLLRWFVVIVVEVFVVALLVVRRCHVFVVLMVSVVVLL